MFRMDRYLLTELTLPFGLTLGVFLLVLIMQQGLRFIDWMVNRGLPLMTVLKMFGYLMPLMLLFALPVAVLIASTSAFNRLAGDRETQALWAIGISPSRVLRPAIIFAGGAALLSTVLLNIGEPVGGESIREAAAALLTQEQTTIMLEEGHFQHMENGLILYVHRSPQPTQLDGVFIFDYRRPAEPQFVIARHGMLHTDTTTHRLDLILQHGSLQRKPAANEPYQRMFFDTYTRRIDLSGLMPLPTVDEQDITTLRQQIRAGKNLDPAALSRLVTYDLYHALPTACLIFGVLGFPLGLLSHRGGRFGGFAAGLGAVILYYFLMTVADSLAQTQRLSPLAAAWLPNSAACLLVLGLLARSLTWPSIFRHRATSREAPPTGHA